MCLDAIERERLRLGTQTHVFFMGNYFGFNVLKLRFKLFNSHQEDCCVRVHFDTFFSLCSQFNIVSHSRPTGAEYGLHFNMIPLYP